MAFRRRGGRHALNRMNPDTRITVAELADRLIPEPDWYLGDQWPHRQRSIASSPPYEYMANWQPGDRVGVEIDGRVHIVDGDRPIDPGVFTADMATKIREWSDSLVGQPYRAPDGRMFSLDDGHPPGFMGTDPYQRDEPLPASGGFRPSTVAAMMAERGYTPGAASELHIGWENEGQPGGQQ